MINIRKAERKKAKLRCALVGVSGSGKTYSSLVIANGIGGKICIIDTENKSADLYANDFEYDVAELAPPFTPSSYVTAIKQIEKSGYDIIIIDSLSHAWSGEGGALDMQSDMMKANKLKNSYTAWRDITPHHNALVNAILQSPCHIIATMRVKTHYDIQQIEKNGKMQSVPVKLGLAPVQREGMEYEFTVVLDINQEHYCTPSKDRTRLFNDLPFIATHKTGEDINNWLNTGKESLLVDQKSEQQNKRIQLSELSDKEKSVIVDKGVAYADRLLECTTLDDLKTIYVTAYKELKKYENIPEGKEALTKIEYAKDERRVQLTIDNLQENKSND